MIPKKTGYGFLYKWDCHLWEMLHCNYIRKAEKRIDFPTEVFTVFILFCFVFTKTVYRIRSGYIGLRDRYTTILSVGCQIYLF